MTGLLINPNNGTRLCVVCRQLYSPNRGLSGKPRKNDLYRYQCSNGCNLDDASEANQHLFYKHFIACEYPTTNSLKIASALEIEEEFAREYANKLFTDEALYQNYDGSYGMTLLQEATDNFQESDRASLVLQE